MDPFKLSQDRFSRIRSSSKEKIEVYSKRCFLDFQNDLIYQMWLDNKNNKNWVRSITRPWYDLIHSCSVSSGLITKEAFTLRQNKKITPTKDHCYRPQFVYRFLLDNREDFLNEKLFREYFILCCTTVLVTGSQNDYLSIHGTDNRKSDQGLAILVATDIQYKNANINLYQLSDHNNWSRKTITLCDNILVTPKPLLEYEQLFTV